VERLHIDTNILSHFHGGRLSSDTYFTDDSSSSVR